MKRALITGIGGQDGSYLAELLLSKGYEVHGLVRRSSSAGGGRLSAVAERVVLHEGDMLDAGSLANAVALASPDEVYNLAAQSHVGASFSTPVYTGDASGLGAVRLLEAMRQVGCRARFYQASTSEMFGGSAPPQNEQTPFRPRSPYAAAKCFAHYSTVHAREAHGLFACSGILFNHESPRRGEAFVTRKVTLAAARIKLGRQRELHLGNLDARRDWGFAPDYVDAMWRMLQKETPSDYVVATGETRSVRDLLDAAFGALDLDWQAHVVVDDKYKRPIDVEDLRGDARRARSDLGWSPTVGFAEMIRAMVESDVATAQK